MRMTTGAALVLAGVALALAGCGDDEDESQAPSAAEKTTATAAARGQDRPPFRGLVAVRDRLQGAGYSVETMLNVPDYADGLPMEVTDGAQTVTVYSYRGKGQLADAKRNFAAIERDAPEQVELLERGRRIYLAVTEAPREVDRVRVGKVVDVGEGG